MFYSQEPVNIILLGERDSEDVIKTRIWYNFIVDQKDSYQRAIERVWNQESDVMMGTETEMFLFESIGIAHELRNIGNHQKVKNARKLIFPSEPAEAASPLTTLTPSK